MLHPLTALAVVMLSLLGSTAPAEPVFDLSTADIKGMRVLPDGRFELTGDAPYPSLTLLAPGGRWDLSDRQFLEVDITNEWSKPLVLTFWALSPGGWGGVSSAAVHPSGRETIPPGQTQTLRIELHARYPGPEVYTKATDPANIDRIRFIFHVRQTGATVRLAKLRATGQHQGPPHDVSRRIVVPPITDEAPAAGRRVRRALPGYEQTSVRHVLSLPRDWQPVGLQPGRRFPVIVEYTGNVFYHKFCHSTGLTEQGNLAYGMSGGEGFILLNLPFIAEDGKTEQIDGWGDVRRTIDYCIDAINDTCERFGGDSGAVFITGFSRGAYACNFIALHDERIADVWLGFDRAPDKPWPQRAGKGWRDVGVGWDERASRVKGRGTFDGKADLGSGVHVDVEYLEDRPVRRQVRAWLEATLQDRPGTSAIRGRVNGPDGQGLPGVRVRSGPTHFAITGADGTYELVGLLPGQRSVQAELPGASFEPASRPVALGAEPATGVNFRAAALAPAAGTPPASGAHTAPTGGR